MPRLFLLRHAKSSPAGPGQKDFDRPLNSRGRVAAAAVGRFMADSGFLPDRILCSPAMRTRETLDHVRPFLPDDTHVDYVRELYESSAEGMFRVIADHAAGAERLLVVGHNPSMHMLARALSHDGDPDLIDQLRAKYPTAALAAIDLPGGNWSAIRPGGGQLVAHVTPEDLGGPAGD